MEKLPIEEVLTHYGANQVPTSERWRSMRCPFHDDRSASASVNTSTNKFRCFACDISGDGIDLINLREGYNDFTSALRYAESIFGRSLGDLPQSGGKRSRRSGLSDTEPGAITGQSSISPNRVRRKPLAGA